MGVKVKYDTLLGRIREHDGVVRTSDKLRLDDATANITLQSAMTAIDNYFGSGAGSSLAFFGQEQISARIAWASKNNIPLWMLLIGDSYSAGNYASNRLKTWPCVFQGSLNAKMRIYGNTQGYVSLNSNAYRNSDVWTYTGTVTNSSGTYGMALFAGIFNQNAYAETTQVCDRFVVFYPKSTGLSGTFKISVDGVDVATGISNNGTTKNSYKWDSYDVLGALSRGSHTIRITGTSVDTSSSTKGTVEGVYFFDGNGEGARVLNAGHAGYLTSQMFAGSATSRTQYDCMRTGIAPPAFVTIECGGNDIIFGVDVATWRTTLEDGIDEVRAVADDYAPTIILMPPHWTDNPQWPVFRQQMYQVARKKNCVVFDWYQILGNILSTSIPAVIDAAEDNLHLNDLGLYTLGTMMSKLAETGMPRVDDSAHRGHPIKKITSDYTPTWDDYEINIDATGGNVTVTAPDGYNHIGAEFLFRRIDDPGVTGNTVDIVGTFDGVSGYALSSLNQRLRVSAEGTGTNYGITGNN